MDVRLISNLDSLNLALDALDEWVVVVDDSAKILFINQPYAQFLGVKREASYGCYVVENTRMHLVVESGQEELSKLQEIRGRHMIANRYPIRQAGKVIGAIGFVLYLYWC